MKTFLIWLVFMTLLSLLDYGCATKELALLPISTFSIQNDGCVAPCQINFTSNAQNASKVLWDFGDGTTSTEVNPSHTFFPAQTYQVKLTVKGEGGSVGKAQTITINSPPKIWDKTLGGSDYDNLSAILETADGGFLLGGTSNSNKSGEKSDNARPSNFFGMGGSLDGIGVLGGDYWVLKLSATGEKQWDKTLGGSDKVGDVLSSIIATPDGGYLLGGYSDSDKSGDKSEDSRGSNDYWVVKISATGEKLWDKTIGGNDSDQLVSMVTTPDGGFLLGGTSYSNKSGEKSEDARKNGDYWVVRLSAAGEKLWDKTLGGVDSDILQSVVATPDGGYLLVGNRHSTMSNGITGTFIGLSDGWVVKISDTGKMLWEKTLGGSDNDYLYATVVTSDGGFLTGGYSYSNKSGDKSEDSRGRTDYWVVKLNATGEKLWDKTLGGDDYDQLYSVVSTLDGGFLVGGYSGSNKSGEKSENAQGGSDYWVVKLSAAGEKLWDKTVGGNYSDQLVSMVTTPDGGFLLGGTSFSNK